MRYNIPYFTLELLYKDPYMEDFCIRTEVRPPPLRKRFIGEA